MGTYFFVCFLFGAWRWNSQHLVHCFIRIYFFCAGNKRGHKGGRRLFTNPQALERQKEKEEKEREWRRKRGEIEDSSEEESDEENSEESSEETSSEEEKEEKEKKKSSLEESEEGEAGKKKGKKVPVLEVCNPNRLPQKQVNKREVDTLVKAGSKVVELSRREREEISKQNERAHYSKLHAQGKTEEARADLARLAIIRQKRDEAAKKRDAEQKTAKTLEIAGSSKSKK